MILRYSFIPSFQRRIMATVQDSGIDMLQRDLLQLIQPTRHCAPILCLPDHVLAEVISFTEFPFCYRVLPFVCARFSAVVNSQSSVEQWSSGIGVFMRAADSSRASSIVRRVRRLRICLTVQTAFCDGPTLQRFALFALPQLSSLRHLDLSRNLIAKNIEQIKSWPVSLVTLNLSGNRIGDFAASMAPFPKSLLTLDLSLNMIGAALWRMPALPASLESLYISGNRLGANVRALLPLPNSLCCLDVSNNELGPALAVLHPLPTKLAALSLGANHIGVSIAFLPPLPSSLARLILSCNQLAPLHFARCPALPTTLRHLDLSGNSVTSHERDFYDGQSVEEDSRSDVAAAAVTQAAGGVLPEGAADPRFTFLTARIVKLLQPHLFICDAVPSVQTPSVESADSLASLDMSDDLNSTTLHSENSPTSHSSHSTPVELVVGSHRGWAERRRRLQAAELVMCRAQVQALRSSAQALRAEAESVR
jgi:hypothetical protein